MSRTFFVFFVTLFLFPIISYAKDIPLPTKAQVFPSYKAVIQPVTNPDPSLSKPIGIGSVASNGDILNLEIGLSKFARPVDIYLAVQISTNPDQIFFLKPNNTFQPISKGWVTWRSNINGPTANSLFKGLSISKLPPAVYNFYLLVTPVGTLDQFYLWSTSFCSVPKPSCCPPIALEPQAQGNYRSMSYKSLYSISSVAI